MKEINGCFERTKSWTMFWYERWCCGGGYAQVVPMEDINLHFTGDFHAITSAHMLLSAMVDNHVYWNLEPKIDPRRITWRRVVDMNDRALRSIVNSLEEFQMVIQEKMVWYNCCLWNNGYFVSIKNFEDLTNRLGKIIIGYTRDLEPVYCRI